MRTALSGKERILRAMAGTENDVMPVCVDYMGLYLEERIEHCYVQAYRERLERDGHVALDPDEDAEIRASAIMEAYGCFNERQDCLNISGGPSREVLAGRELVRENGSIYEEDRAAGTRRRMLRSGEENKTEEMRDRLERLRLRALDQSLVEKLLRDYRERTLCARGNMKIVELIARKYGEHFFLYSGIGAPFVALTDVIGFEGTMVALHDAPQMVLRLMDGLLEAQLELMTRYRDGGGHGIRIEECLASADIISPAMYERFARPYEEKLLAGIRSLGLKAILYFCGDVIPRLPSLRELPMDALMVEESKKDFVIDIGEVRELAGPDLCLLGNIDVYEILFKGTPAEIQAEVSRQVALAGQEGRFIVGIGSPVTLDTPPEKVDILIRAAREQKPAGRTA